MSQISQVLRALNFVRYRNSCRFYLFSCSSFCQWTKLAKRSIELFSSSVLKAFNWAPENKILKLKAPKWKPSTESLKAFNIQNIPWPLQTLPKLSGCSHCFPHIFRKGKSFCLNDEDSSNDNKKIQQKFFSL